MIPVYAFLEGDTLGLLLFAYPNETVGAFTEKLELSAKFRVPRKRKPALIFAGEKLDPEILLGATSIKSLDRIDVIETVT
jgi:hypothetical protein